MVESAGLLTFTGAVHDKDKIDQLGSLDFYASSGQESVGVVPKLHNTSAGIEIYQLPPPLTKETFEKTEGPYRSGVTKKYSNKRSGEKIAKFKAGTMAQSGLACFHISRLLGHLVEVPPATYRTMDLQEFQKVGEQARTTGHPSCTEAWANLRAMAKSGSSTLVLPDGKAVYGSLAENPRGENSSPEDYWTVGAIRGHSFYKVVSSKEPVANVLNLSDPKCLQDLALAQDMMMYGENFAFAIRNGLQDIAEIFIGQIDVQIFDGLKQRAVLSSPKDHFGPRDH